MRHPRLTLILALAALAATSVFAATVWKWVDKNGVTHYSDQPVPGAIQVDLLNVQTYGAEEAALPPTPRSNRNKENASASASYRLIEIVRPANEQTFSGENAQQISVTVRVDPALQQGHSLQLELDGQSVSEPNSTTTNFELKEIPRGAHTLSAAVMTTDGRSVIQSAPVTFFVQQASILRKKN